MTIPNVTIVPVTQAQVDASARMLGLPTFGTTQSDVTYMFMARPSAATSSTALVVQTVAPYRCQTQPQVNVSILEGTNDLIQVRIDNQFLTGTLRGGTLQRPEIYTVDS